MTRLAPLLLLAACASFPAPVATLTSHTLLVGGTLNVGASQALGAYTGTFTVNVAYP